MENEIKEKRFNTGAEHIISIKIGKAIFLIIAFCFAVEFLLFFLDIIVTYKKIIPVEELGEIFNLTLEASIGTWFSSVQAFLAAITLLVISLTLKFYGKNNFKVAGWFILSLFFIYISMDDCAYIHERAGNFVERITVSGELSPDLSEKLEKFPTYYWHLILGPFFALTGFFMFFFLWYELGGMKLRPCLVFSMLCFFIALCLDFLEGISEFVLKIGLFFMLSHSTTTHFLRITEETIEMFAITLLFYIFLKYFEGLWEGKKVLIEKR